MLCSKYYIKGKTVQKKKKDHPSSCRVDNICAVTQRRVEGGDGRNWSNAVRLLKSTCWLGQITMKQRAVSNSAFDSAHDLEHLKFRSCIKMTNDLTVSWLVRALKTQFTLTGRTRATRPRERKENKALHPNLTNWPSTLGLHTSSALKKKKNKK